jgi:hypothetical protein
MCFSIQFRNHRDLRWCKTKRSPLLACIGEPPTNSLIQQVWLGDLLTSEVGWCLIYYPDGSTGRSNGARLTAGRFRPSAGHPDGGFLWGLLPNKNGSLVWEPSFRLSTFYHAIWKVPPVLAASV